VAIRRLRSTLRVFGKPLDGTKIGDPDGELKWFAGLLGDVRDTACCTRDQQIARQCRRDVLLLG
jgi:CHAD domain-containing protein